MRNYASGEGIGNFISFLVAMTSELKIKYWNTEKTIITGLWATGPATWGVDAW